MGGLLYKDFIATKGKIVAITFGVIIFVAVVLRLVFPELNPPAILMLENDHGATTNMIELILVCAYWIALLFFLFSINSMEEIIVDGDRKNKVMNYFHSMPFSKETYYASKYVFIGINAYVFYSISLILQTILASFLKEGWALEFLEQTSSLTIPLFSLMLFLASFDLPMYILWGKEKAIMLRDIVLLVLASIVTGYFFFGDISIFENFDVDVFVAWIKNHQFEMVLLQVFSPIIVLGIYYLSYRITCYFGRGEVSVNE